MATVGQHAQHSHVAGGRRFLLHLGEMYLAMAVGMALFGALFGAILLVAGTNSSELLADAPEAFAFAMMFNMTVPMLLWMRHRGHPPARLVEMALAMLAVCAVACLSLWSSVIEPTAICGVECALMIPATLAVMLLHPGEYSRPVHPSGSGPRRLAVR